jgi:isopentenyl phosphate kinase
METPTDTANDLHFLKLGGSLITEKDKPRTPRLDLINRLAEEVYRIKQEMPRLRLVLGHGSGSFGHVPAKKFGTREGVKSPAEWRGFSEVWWEAASLNHLVMSALHQAGLAAIAFPASAAAVTRDGRVISWDLEPLIAALAQDLLPVVYGDVVFDTRRRGTILSTEDIFSYLAPVLQPKRIYLAGIEDGVWGDYPQCTRLLPEITPSNLAVAAPFLAESQATDVTGGMASKVVGMLALVSQIPGLEVRIFSAVEPGRLLDVLRGKAIGTRLRVG